MAVRIMVKERRKRTRIPAHFDVSIISGRAKIKVKTLNISLTGISCTGDLGFQVNELCDIIMNLNSDVILAIAGKIIRIDENETIIAFLAMDEDTFYHLKKLIQHNAVNPDKIEKELADPAFA
jgi:hypothetical protein